MRRLLMIASVCLLVLAGCLGPSLPSVSPASPADGSAVGTLTPVLIWGGGAAGAAYRVVVAADSNFQDTVIDAGSIENSSYTVPSGKLNGNSIYYWRVMAVKGNQLSNWSAAWSFRTSGSSPTNNGNISINATLNGVAWSGSANYRVSGTFSDSENTVPWSFNDVAAGTYTLTYNFGGPSGATLSSITPAPSQQVVSGRTVTFTLNYQTAVSSRINVNAVLDGVAWTGNVNYSIYGPFRDVDTMVPHTFISVPAGAYTISYNSGGPQNAVFSGISPSPSQVLTSGGEITYTLNFTSSGLSTLSVMAYYNGASWSGPVSYSISGPVTGSYSTVPLNLGSVPSGTYRITYRSGGPAGATLGGIIPDTTLVVSKGRPGSFTLNYYAQAQTGTVVVNATLNGSAYTGDLDFDISGPFEHSEYQVPRTYSSSPTGRYSVTYAGGGPAGAVFTGISPSTVQSLSAGRTIVFTLNFTSQPKTGSINVYATVDGRSWQTNPGSGDISYSLTGPYHSDMENVIPGRWTDMPAGIYTLTFNSGGPIGATLTSISPAPSLSLSAGGSITFTMNFTSQARGSIAVQATLDGRPWSGSASYVVHGPYVESGDSVSRTFSNAPPGTYSVDFREGGPYTSEFTGVSPSSQELSSGGYIVFTLTFRSFPGPGPMPGPVPHPTPGPMPGPIPHPDPDPDPDEPIPGPVPNPTPVEPMPGPVPNPTPDEPVPGPVPNSTPYEPMPGPVVSPTPEPEPETTHILLEE